MKKYIFPTIVVVSLCLGFVGGNMLSEKAHAQSLNWGGLRFHLGKVDQTISYIEQAYVDEVDIDSVTDEVMIDLIKQLDPHSAYIPKKDLEIVNSELDASFSGIGVQFSIQNDTVSIVAVVSGGPSEGIGILAGDKIVEVDDSVFCGKGINNERVMRTLRGEKGTKVKLTIRRSGESEPLYFTVTRGDIPVHSIDASFMATKNIGFIRVSKFSETTYDEFISALARLRSEGADSYIIDLRENSGGYMDKAIRMANEFLSSGDMIVYAEGRAYNRYEARSNGIGRFKNVPLVVLIDEFSASASEIFAGAMQDNDRATIIGRRSFGKGLVQQQMPLIDGSAVRLTVARYYTPSGRCIQKPYEMGKGEDYMKDIIDRYDHGEFFSADSIHMTDTTTYLTKKGRVVHGGGGIMPDIFIGRDTSLNTPWYNRVVNRAYTYQFAYQYTDRHRKELNKIRDWQDMEKWLKKQNWIPEFVQFCKDKGVEPNDKEIEKSKPLLLRIVNAYIVRNTLGDDAFFQLYERDDEVTREAIQQLSQKK
ncbi:MAG: S41 family peptidase [Paludibacteraceae bacterium]|nr:S41 family peptidase [Paludibacteraceae bacterium]